MSQLVDSCCFYQCESVPELTIVINERNYRICLKHYLFIIKLLDKACNKHGKSSLDDLKIYEKDGKVIKLEI